MAPSKTVERNHGSACLTIPATKTKNTHKLLDSAEGHDPAFFILLARRQSVNLVQLLFHHEIRVDPRKLDSGVGVDDLGSHQIFHGDCGRPRDVVDGTVGNECTAKCRRIWLGL